MADALNHAFTEGLVVIITCFASGVTISAALWAYIRKRTANNKAHTLLLMGLASDKFITLGLQYVERGWVSRDEYEDLRRYLYDPYLTLGGNGTVDRVMRLVDELEFKPREDIKYPMPGSIPLKVEKKEDSDAQTSGT